MGMYYTIACAVVLLTAGVQAAGTVAERLGRINAASERTAALGKETCRKADEFGLAKVGQCVVIAPSGPGMRNVCKRVATVAKDQNWQVHVVIGDRPLLVDRARATNEDEPDWLWISGNEEAVIGAMRNLVEAESTVRE